MCACGVCVHMCVEVVQFVFVCVFSYMGLYCFVCCKYVGICIHHGIMVSFVSPFSILLSQSLGFVS
jgi:hypothetical protein